MFKGYIKNKLIEELPKLNEVGVYAISFFLDCNDANTIKPQFMISSNVENSSNSDLMSEERWNFAFWQMNVIDIIGDYDRQSIENLNAWYNEIGIKNPGYEDLADHVAYKNYMYIGNGPEGINEFVALLVEIVQELHSSGYIVDTFGTAIPIIIHNLEYVWYMINATIKANPRELIIDFEHYMDLNQ